MGEELQVMNNKMSREQVELIKKAICPPNTSDEDLAVVIMTIERTGLDPFKKQVHILSRWTKDGDKITVQTSIDGYRLIAQRTGNYEGQAPQEWCGPDGIWKQVWLADYPPSAARVGVYKKGCREPIWAVATWRSYVQTKRDNTPTAMWLKMPDVMISKCAEALALRKAFPAELSGIYTEEEMGQADNHEGFNSQQNRSAPSQEAPKQLPSEEDKLLEQRLADPTTTKLFDALSTYMKITPAKRLQTVKKYKEDEKLWEVLETQLKKAEDKAEAAKDTRAETKDDKEASQ